MTLDPKLIALAETILDRQAGGRKPANPHVACECGCGEQLRSLDERGRPRRFLPGHHNKLASAQEARELAELMALPRDELDRRAARALLKRPETRALGKALDRRRGSGQ